jgi:hypothetical protein
LRASLKTSSDGAASNSCRARSTRSAIRTPRRSSRRRGQGADDRGHVRGGEAGQSLVEAGRDLVEAGLVGAFVERHEELANGALGEDQDEAGQAVAGLDQVEAAQARSLGLGGRRDARHVRGTGKCRCSQPEPLLAGELDLAELVADHELLDGRQDDRIRDGLDVQAVAGIGRDAAGARVRAAQEAGPLELGHHVADRRGADVKTVFDDERLARHRLGGGHVFLDDGPQDGRGARVERAGAVLASRHACWSSILCPMSVVSTLGL